MYYKILFISISFFLIITQGLTQEDFLRKIDSLKQAKLNSSLSGIEEIYKVVEVMPRFPGCEDMDGTEEEKRNCANQQMLAFIYTANGVKL